MPLDYHTVYRQINRFAEGAKAFYERQAADAAAVRETLLAWAEKGGALTERVMEAVRLEPHWRSAMPGDEPLAAAVPPPGDAAARVSAALVLAADGSQIEPDPHAGLYYALVNVGMVMMAHDLTPRTHITSELWSPADLANQRLQVGLQRDLRERQALAEAAEVLAGEAAPSPDREAFFADAPTDRAIVALTDGPLELWGAKDDPTGAFRAALAAYLRHLRTLARLDTLSAGYVDNPRANLVVHMLALAALEDVPRAEDLRAIHHGEFAFQGVTDRMLFSALLAPGERSAVFGLVSQSREDYSEALALHFFYLNTSPDPQAPNIARVEIPAWVAQDAEAVATLHAVLLWQSRRVPHTAYPYVLHRAHEVAVVRREDRQAVETWLRQALLDHGIQPPLPSAKQRLKNMRRSP